MNTFVLPQKFLPTFTVLCTDLFISLILVDLVITVRLSMLICNHAKGCNYVPYPHEILNGFKFGSDRRPIFGDDCEIIRCGNGPTTEIFPNFAVAPQDTIKDQWRRNFALD